ncbi:hypothetical protein TYRP_012012 [Tyrophagus putrescentiae]|nr:hypothetical protein TYRP_012012 [Tyrophagus putrescentiae]
MDSFRLVNGNGTAILKTEWLQASGRLRPYAMLLLDNYRITVKTFYLHSKCEQNVNDEDDDDGRIMNGQIVPDGKYPFIASLQVSPEPCAGTSPGAHFCGGAVINDNTVLTAAHCLTAMNLTETSVLVGVYSMDASNLDDYHCYQADKLVVHPRYTAEHFSGTPDIGVVKLKRAIEFEKTNKQVSRICLPHPNESPIPNRCTILGWGAFGDNLRELSRNLLENRVTAVRTKEFSDQGREMHYKIMYSHSGSSSCFGDSGGPLVCSVEGDESGTNVQFGVSSFVSGKCNKYSAYTKRCPLQ